MKAGKLRHRVTLQAPGGTQDPVTGEMTPGWADVATVWAHVRYTSGREFRQSATDQAQGIGDITMRHREDVAANWRGLWRGKVLNLSAPLPDEESGRDYLTIPFTEGVGDGE